MDATDVKPHYPHESAGTIMEKNVPTASPGETIGDVFARISAKAKTMATLNYVYILNSKQELVGVLSIKHLFTAKKIDTVDSLMVTQPVFVHIHTDQERVAQLAIKHNIKSVPVVDPKGKFAGIVASDVILSILHQEHIEDVLHSIGMHSGGLYKRINTATPFEFFKTRLPWLLVGLGGGLIAAIVVGKFESVLSEMLILASFIPSVVYIADAVGTQTQTLFIRSLAIDESLMMRRYVSREAFVAVMIALTFGILMYAASFLWDPDQRLGIILGVSFTCTILVSSIVAIILPYTLNRLRIDPAVASGPLATVIRDILNISIYFFIASTVLGNL